MTNEVVKGMERARHEAYWSSTASAGVTMEEEAMRAALIWLSENVPDGMTCEFENHVLQKRGFIGSRAIKEAISAAIRKAAEG